MVNSPGVARFLLKALKKYKGYVVASFFCATFMAALSIGTYDLLGRLVDQALQKSDFARALRYCGYFIGIFFVTGIATYLNRFLIRVAVEKLVFDLRKRLFDRLLIFSQLQLSEYSSGQALGHIVNDVSVISRGLDVIADLIEHPQLILAVLGYLFYLNWKLTMVCILLLPMVGWIGGRLGRSSRRNQTRILEALERISSMVVDSVRGLRTAHAFGRTKQLRAEFEEYNEKNLRHSIRLARVEEVTAPITKWITAVVGAGIIAFGAYLILVDHSLKLGALVAYLTAAGGLTQPVRQLNIVNVRLQSVFAAASRIKKILELDLDSLALEQAKLLDLPEPTPAFSEPFCKLEFRDLSFRYPIRTGAGELLKSDPDDWALDKINLEIRAGESVALVGESGSGKSTLSLLALRFLDPQQGSVALNGRLATEIPLNEYRSLFSYVSQDVHLFQKSLRTNLLFAKSDATDAELWNALERASVADFVRNLPYGLETELGEQASKISGGERQRLGIARAFLRNSPVLILDEITSQLDSRSEAKVQSALKELFKGRTVLIIAHRLSTIRAADRVVVLADGKIVETGHPSELIDRPGSHFGSFWRAQQSHGEIH